MSSDKQCDDGVDIVELEDAPATPSTASVDQTNLERAESWFSRHTESRVPLVAMNDDAYRVPGQNWVCFSTLRPGDYGEVKKRDGTPYTSTLIKFRGVFDTIDKASASIRDMMKLDPNHDVHLVPAHKWTLLDDDDPNVENTEYQNEVIQGVMKGYIDREKQAAAGVSARMAGMTTREDLEALKRSGSTFADSLNVEEVLAERDRMMELLKNQED